MPFNEDARLLDGPPPVPRPDLDLPVLPQCRVEGQDKVVPIMRRRRRIAGRLPGSQFPVQRMERLQDIVEQFLEGGLEFRVAGLDGPLAFKAQVESEIRIRRERSRAGDHF